MLKICEVTLFTFVIGFPEEGVVMLVIGLLVRIVDMLMSKLA